MTVYIFAESPALLSARYPATEPEILLQGHTHKKPVGLNEHLKLEYITRFFVATERW